MGKNIGATFRGASAKHGTVSPKMWFGPQIALSAFGQGRSPSRQGAAIGGPLVESCCAVTRHMSSHHVSTANNGRLADRIITNL